MSANGHRHEISRRRLLRLGIAAPVVIAAGAVAGVELSGDRSRTDGILSGPALSSFTGPCATVPVSAHLDRGPTYSGTFYSAARGRTVSYRLAYPPEHERGDVLPLAIYLHPYGGSSASPFGGYSLATALALGRDARPLSPMAMICADGGDGYWHPHPGDDPLAMVTDELIPMCRRIGLGHRPDPIVVTGIAMGGYGAILLAERSPGAFAAVAAISPTIWTDYERVAAASPGAFSSAEEFAEYDVVSGAAALAATPVRAACGRSDPLHLGDELLARACPKDVAVVFLPGDGSDAFTAGQVWPSLQFLSDHLPKSSEAQPAPLECPDGPP